MSEKIALNLRGDLFDRIINNDVAFFDETKTGDLCNFSLFILE